MRIVVVGTSGSGKSTMARGLGQALGLRVVELDAINWQPGWRALDKDDPAEFRSRVAAATAGDNWVSDGTTRPSATTSGPAPPTWSGWTTSDP